MLRALINFIRYGNAFVKVEDTVYGITNLPPAFYKKSKKQQAKFWSSIIQVAIKELSELGIAKPEVIEIPERNIFHHINTDAPIFSQDYYKMNSENRIEYLKTRIKQFERIIESECGMSDMPAGAGIPQKRT